MKKFKKLIFIIILLIIVIFVCFRIKDYIILSKITKVSEGLLSSFEPYFIKTTMYSSSDEIIFIDENYRQNDIIVSRNTRLENGKTTSVSTTWASLKEEFCNFYITDTQMQEDGTETKILVCSVDSKNRIKENLEENYFINYSGYNIKQLEIECAETWINIRNKIEDIFFYPSVSTGEYKGKECYVFKPYGYNSHMKMYVDKDSLLTIATEGWNNIDEEHSFTEYEYLTEAPEGIYQKPNPEDFDNVTFSDSNSNNFDPINKLVAENPISGTTLEPGEMLVENVEIKNKDDINFLKLTPNESGIMKFEIYNLETYNMFRKKYPELRELNEEDFDFYYVAIAYKIGEKLNYLEHYMSSDAWIENFVVNSEKTNKESLLMAVIPIEHKNLKTVFVENKEKLKINSEQAISKSSESLEDIEKDFGIEFETYLGYLEDHLDLLTKEEFSKLEYIKTPIAGKERICWNLHYRVVDHETINYIEAYIDAITGELIGAKKFYK